MAQAKPKANSIVTHEVHDDGRITFYVLGVGALEFDRNKAAGSNRARAETHGWIQRIVDAAAIGVTDSDGNIIPKEQRNRMKYHAMHDIITHYESGSEEWSRAGGGGGTRSLTVEAIARVQRIEYDEAVEMVERHAERKYGGDTKKALAKLRGAADVQKAMQAIRDERTPKANIDADKELEELMAA